MRLSWLLTMSSAKRIVLVRHGISQMNIALCAQPWGSRGFVDPAIYDAPLTEKGMEQAARTEAPEVELVVSSPLTRALQTAKRVFGEARLGPEKALMLPLAAERVYLSSDVGTARSQLEGDWGHLFSLAFVDNEEWWYDGPQDDYDEWRPPGTYLCPGEPQAAFIERMHRLLAWLDQRAESTIALVCHWGVIHALTGQDFENCQVRTVDFADLKVRQPPY